VVRLTDYGTATQCTKSTVTSRSDILLQNSLGFSRLITAGLTLGPKPPINKWPSSILLLASVSIHNSLP